LNDIFSPISLISINLAQPKLKPH